MEASQRRCVIEWLQYDLRDGPCVDTIAEHETFRVSDVGEEVRWPSFNPAAAKNGIIHSLLSYRLFVTDRTLEPRHHRHRQGHPHGAPRH